VGPRPALHILRSAPLHHHRFALHSSFREQFWPTPHRGTRASFPPTMVLTPPAGNADASQRGESARRWRGGGV
jgi:hypothetical protein